MLTKNQSTIFAYKTAQIRIGILLNSHPSASFLSGHDPILSVYYLSMKLNRISLFAYLSEQCL